MVRLFAAIFILLAAIQQASAGDGLRVSLLSGGFGKSGSTALFGLKVDMEPGWHAYWRSPGETGLPPDLKVSPASGSAKIFWPVPERFSASGFETVGYRKSFVIPIVASGVDARADASVTVSGTLYACSDICVPFPISASATASAGSSEASSLREIAYWLARSPGGAGGSGVRIQSVRKDGHDIVATFSSRAGMTAPQAFLDMGMEAFGSLKSLDVDTGGTATARFGIVSLRKATPDFSHARLVISDGRSAPIDTDFELQHDAAAGILLVALLGGFILNAMPCVFPVLAIKLLLLVSTDRKRLRPSLLAMAAGVVATFLVIGGTLAAAKGAGHTIGWGMQFQQPIFLAGMAVQLCAFGASMSGAFDIILPSSVATRVTSATDGSGAWKSFLQGMVLTLLATPCSAPFVGTAVGYGLSSGGYAEVLSVFAALGIGMAAPFLLLALYPKAVSMLPRPGRWMEHVKLATGLGMFATAGWLLFLVHSTGSTIALSVALAAAVAALATTALVSRRMLAAQVAALMLAPLLFLAPDLAPAAGVRWQKFDPSAIESLVNDGRTVFVDISADWCLTCKVNERGVLSSEPTIAILEKTVPMKGDWTRPDEEISHYLKGYGRYGIPFYLVIGPGAKNGILLRELLTEDAVRQAVENASR